MLFDGFGTVLCLAPLGISCQPPDDSCLTSEPVHPLSSSRYFRAIRSYSAYLRVSVAVCGNLNIIGPHNLIGGGSIRMCGFVGVDMALLEEVCHCGCGL